MDAHGQRAGGSRGRKAGLDQRCRELRDLVTLQAQGMKIFTQSCEEKLRQNRELLPSLQQELQKDTHVMDTVLKTNKLPMDDAFAEAQAVAAVPEDLQEVQKRLEAIIHGQVKVCDMLEHQVKQWTKMRDDRQMYLQQLQNAEMDDTLAQPQLQEIRRLNNEIEKMLMKIHVVQRLTNHYLQLRDSLKNELFSAPQYLDLMLGMTEMYSEELAARQNPKAADTIRKLMAEAGPQVHMERLLHAQTLAEQRANVRSLQQKTESERELREQAVSLLSTDEAQTSLDLMGANVEVTMTQMEREAFVNEKMEKAKAALQCSSLWDIPSSLLAQQKTLEDLEKYIQESRENERVLKQMLQELELKHAKLKFHQPLETTRLREEELRAKLEQEEARRDKLQDQLMRNQEKLIEFENGIDNLFVRLRGIVVPGKEESVKPTGVEEKLQQCAEKLLYLKQRVLDHPDVAQSYDKGSKTFAMVRDLLEKSIAAETQNLKISFEDEDDIAQDSLDFEEEDDDDYVPSREDIKKQGLQLIKMNTKRPKRK